MSRNPREPLLDPVKMIMRLADRRRATAFLPAGREPGELAEGDFQPIGEIERRLQQRESVVVEPARVGVGAEVEPVARAGVSPGRRIRRVLAGLLLLCGGAYEAGAIAELVESRGGVAAVDLQPLRRVRDCLFRGRRSIRRRSTAQDSLEPIEQAHARLRLRFAKGSSAADSEDGSRAAQRILWRRPRRLRVQPSPVSSAE